VQRLGLGRTGAAAVPDGNPVRRRRQLRTPELQPFQTALPCTGANCMIPEPEGMQIAWGF
jgi:hypothetical protein